MEDWRYSKLCAQVCVCTYSILGTSIQLQQRLMHKSLRNLNLVQLIQRFEHNIATQAQCLYISTTSMHHLCTSLCAHDQLIKTVHESVYINSVQLPLQEKTSSLIVFHYQVGKVYQSRSIFIYVIYVSVKKTIKLA